MPSGPGPTGLMGKGRLCESPPEAWIQEGAFFLREAQPGPFGDPIRHSIEYIFTIRNDRHFRGAGEGVQAGEGRGHFHAIVGRVEGSASKLQFHSAGP